MRVLVTGGTGFVGAHSVAELVHSGHEVRLLVRDRRGIEPALAPLGIPDPPSIEGDVADPISVKKAMEGCEAVLHAASIYSLDVRRGAALQRVNVGGTETVLGVAHRLGLDPIVYVSSLVSLFPPEGRVLTKGSPVKDPPGAYYKSKADAERVARRYQEQGAPVVISYPSAVFGPHDPHFGESAKAVRNILAGRVRFTPPGGLSVVDVRDLAQAHAAVFEAGRGPRRYMLSGTNVPFSKIIETLGELTGRRITYATLPAWLLRPAVQALGWVQRFLPMELPTSPEGFNAIAWNPHADDTEAIADLGFTPRDVRETFADTVRWEFEVGKVTAKQAGSLAIGPIGQGKAE